MSSSQFNFCEISAAHLHRFSVGHVAKSGDTKFYLKSFKDDVSSKNQFFNEQSFHQKIGSVVNILPLLGTHEIAGETFLVFPFIEKDIFDFIGKVPSQSLISDILLPVLDCLEQIHKAGFIRRYQFHANLCL